MRTIWSLYLEIESLSNTESGLLVSILLQRLPEVTIVNLDRAKVVHRDSGLDLLQKLLHEEVTHLEVCRRHRETAERKSQRDRNKSDQNYNQRKRHTK